MKIFVTGASGFVGQNAIRSFAGTHEIIPFNRVDIPLEADVYLHLAGKAHDLKKTSSPEDYYLVNTELTKKVFDQFLKSNAAVFIFLSSVKAVADVVGDILLEDHPARPVTHYGKSKLLAEQYILSKPLPHGKRAYILRPCMIHGPGNKGNLNLLYQIASKGVPWPLGAFANSRSFCSIDNLLFVIRELMERAHIPSGIYNVADDAPLSTVDVIRLIYQSEGRKPRVWKVPQGVISSLAKIGDRLRLPLNTERLGKLTENYVVSNRKLHQALGKELPLDVRTGMLLTLQSFKKNA